MNERITDADFVELLDDMWRLTAPTANQGEVLRFLTSAVVLVGRVLVNMRDAQEGKQ